MAKGGTCYGDTLKLSACKLNRTIRLRENTHRQIRSLLFAPEGNTVGIETSAKAWCSLPSSRRSHQSWRVAPVGVPERFDRIQASILVHGSLLAITYLLVALNLRHRFINTRSESLFHVTLTLTRGLHHGSCGAGSGTCDRSVELERRRLVNRSKVHRYIYTRFGPGGVYFPDVPRTSDNRKRRRPLIPSG